jgi:hypothetical protein
MTATAVIRSSARLVAELEDGSHVVLLDDRGWTSGRGGVAGHGPEEVEISDRLRGSLTSPRPS